MTCVNVCAEVRMLPLLPGERSWSNAGGRWCGWCGILSRPHFPVTWLFCLLLLQKAHGTGPVSDQEAEVGPREGVHGQGPGTEWKEGWEGARGWGPRGAGPAAPGAELRQRGAEPLKRLRARGIPVFMDSRGHSVMSLVTPSHFPLCKAPGALSGVPGRINCLNA